jgi:hypothetical protein
MYGDHFEIAIEFGRLLPKAVAWSDGYVYLGAGKDLHITAVARIYAENLSSPTEYPLTFEICGKTEPMDGQAMVKLLEARGM